MQNWLGRYIRPVRWMLLVGTGIAIGVGAFLSAGSRMQMPPDQQRYWNWVGASRERADVQLASGITLLQEHPRLRLLYLRLVPLCLASDTPEGCRDVLKKIRPPTSLARLYQEAALALLDPDVSVTPWQQLARAPELDPTLARLCLDQAGPAASAFTEAIWQHRLKEDSSAVGALFGLGYAAVLRHEWAVGEHFLKQVTALKPDDSHAYRELGRIYYHKGQPEQLERMLEAGIRAAESQFDLEQELILRGNLGWTLFQREGDLARAEQLITTALDQSRRLADERTEGYNLYRLASIYLQQQRYEAAIPLLRSADGLYARYAPRRHAEVTALHGIVLSRMYRLNDAEQTLGRAIGEAEESGYISIQVQALVALAQLHLSMGRYVGVHEAGGEALALAERYGFKDQSLTAHLTLGDAARRWGAYGEAALHYEQALSLSLQTKSIVRRQEAYYRLGLAALDRQDPYAARLYFEESLRSVEQSGRATHLADAYLGLGRTYARLGDTREALHYYDAGLARVARADPVHANLLIAKARVLFEAEALHEARALFEKAERVLPASSSVRYRVEAGLGELALTEGACERALQHFEQAQTLHELKPNPTIHWYTRGGLARTYWCLGNLARAEAAFHETIELVDAYRDALQGTDAVALVPDAAHVYEQFAAFLEEQGRVDEAFQYLERARRRRLASSETSLFAF